MSAAPIKIIKLEELRAHNSKESLYLLIHGKVYDCTKFLDEHPGGDEVMTAESGQDATEAFEDVGHSDEARDLLPGMLIGELEENSVRQQKSKSSPLPPPPQAARVSSVEQGSTLMYWAPLALLAGWFGYRFYTTGTPY
ncbi:Cytochrome b5 heme-binding domain-containing protein [Mycena indigotica]|uniref:Cytochrome b5 heme-binding domain-containing protein n=1 Tax=Mycena indigotica TaxID=2126181 RepID=A0A8H6W7J2_9AGAR|nr:Cytochrome b5 heme-binding domain-containing protein [Mycena indigotica]KAF7302154.1 Cytochrome b5 heme-binding domain-containing protein [Mycena indigotica]